MSESAADPSTLISKLQSLGQGALQEVAASPSTDALEQVRVKTLGKKGTLSEVLKGLGSVAAADRPKIGAVANEWKSKIEVALEARGQELAARELASLRRSASM